VCTGGVALAAAAAAAGEVAVRAGAASGALFYFGHALGGKGTRLAQVCLCTTPAFTVSCGVVWRLEEEVGLAQVLAAREGVLRARDSGADDSWGWEGKRQQDPEVCGVCCCCRSCGRARGLIRCRWVPLVECIGRLCLALVLTS